MKKCFTSLAIICCAYQLNAQTTLDISLIENWPLLHNSVTNWEDGAFNVSTDENNNNDLSWGFYNPDNHNVYGDSIYIMEWPNNVFKQLYIEKLENKQFTLHTATIDGGEVTTIVIDKDDYQGKNFGYYSFYFEEENHDIEPLANEWDLVFMRYNRLGDHYGVAGVLANNGVSIAEARDVDPASVEPSSLSYTSEINEIGYDWKQFGASGFEVVDNLSYYVIGLNGDTSQVIFQDFTGSSGGGTSTFTVDGVSQTVSMGNAYVDRVFYSLENGIVHTSARNGWDIAFDGTAFGTTIRTNEEIGHRLWVYPLADASLWNESISVTEIDEALALVKLHPNPVNEQLTLHIHSKKPQEVYLEIYDMEGRKILENQTQLQAGMMSMQLQMNIPSGQYQLIGSDTEGKALFQHKIIKL